MSDWFQDILKRLFLRKPNPFFNWYLIKNRSYLANCKFIDCKIGDSDFGDIVMLVTLWIINYDGDWFHMLVAESLCWRLFCYVGDFLNVLNGSPTSQTCHQHIWSPTSVTNIDVTVKSDPGNSKKCKNPNRPLAINSKIKFLVNFDQKSIFIREIDSIKVHCYLEFVLCRRMI